MLVTLFIGHFVVGILCGLNLSYAMFRNHRRKYPEITSDKYSEEFNSAHGLLILICVIGGYFAVPASLSDICFKT